MFGLTTLELIGLGQLFLMVMVVVGFAAQASSDSTNQHQGLGDLLAGFALTLVLWLVLTVVVIASIGALVWGAFWMWSRPG